MSNIELGQLDREREAGLRSLAHELKYPLVAIAREAELYTQTSIQKTAQNTLRLIDSYLLHAQTEYGQVALPLTPTSLGSVMYDVAITLDIPVEIEDRCPDLVMSHRPALVSILNACSDMLRTSVSAKRLTLRAYKNRAGQLQVGVFSPEIVRQADLETARRIRGYAHGAGQASLTIADGLCTSLGGTLQIKKLGSLYGFATVLPPSEQLALI